MFSLVASYEWTHQWLGRISHDSKILSPREVQEIILKHGQALREQEYSQAQELLSQDSVAGEGLLLPNVPQRRGPAWPEPVAEAVEDGLNQKGFNQPPMRPKLASNQLLLALDAILVRGRSKKSHLELRVARLQTSSGYRYLTGSGETFLTKLSAAIRALAGPETFLTILADGARWIRNFSEAELCSYKQKELILDWFHLTKKSKELLSMVTHGPKHKKEVLKQLMPLLWEGKVEKALSSLESLRTNARRADKLDELIDYLRKHTLFIPNYRQRRAQCRFNSSNAAERACNLLVARRQKNKSMHWIDKGADALCALVTLWHNRAWDLYWKTRQSLPLIIPSHPTAFAC